MTRCTVVVPFQEQLIEEFGSKYNRSKRLPENLGLFHSSRIPCIDINDYYNRIIQYTNCEQVVIQTMWVYLKRVVYDNDLELDEFNIHRLVSQAFNIALKFLDDHHISDKQFCRIVGYKCEEFASLEINFLQLLSFDCWV